MSLDKAETKEPYVSPILIEKQINLVLKPDGWETMTVYNMIMKMLETNQQYAVLKNAAGDNAMVTLHETTLMPQFMETCATVYVLSHLEPEIKTGVCGVVCGRSEKQYLLTIKKRDGLLRFGNDSWSFK